MPRRMHSNDGSRKRQDPGGHESLGIPDRESHKEKARRRRESERRRKRDHEDEDYEE